jgi:hypothetical protein
VNDLESNSHFTFLSIVHNQVNNNYFLRKKYAKNFPDAVVFDFGPIRLAKQDILKTCSNITCILGLIFFSGCLNKIKYFSPCHRIF